MNPFNIETAERSNNSVFLHSENFESNSAQDHMPESMMDIPVIHKKTVSYTALTKPACLTSITDQVLKNRKPLLFRDSVLDECLSRLNSMNLHNIILKGASGAGKTSIVYELAWRLIRDAYNIPPRLQNCQVMELSCADLKIAHQKNHLETALKNVVSYIENSREPILLFVDEAHQLMEAPLTQAAQALKPLLTSENFYMILAATTQEAVMFSKDPAFARRFETINIRELTRKETVEVLREYLPMLLKYHPFTRLNDDVLNSIPELTDRYGKPGCHPGKDIDILDKAMSDAYLNRFKQLNPKNREELIHTTIPVTEEMIKETALKSINIKNRIISNESLKTAFSIIEGQDEAIQEIITTILQREDNLFDPKRPLSFLLAGSSGSGKTETGRIIARILTDMEPIIIRCPEFTDKSALNRLLGSPSGYVDSDSHQERPLDKLKTQPNAVLIIDEFEKGSRALQHLFMAALDDGKISDNRNQEIDFSRSTMIFTTNAGGFKMKTNMYGQPLKNQTWTEKEKINALKSAFPPEVLGRFTKVLAYNCLSEEQYRSILTSAYNRKIALLEEEKGYIFDPSIPEDKLDQLVKDNYVRETGARTVEKAVEAYIQSLKDAGQYKQIEKQTLQPEFIPPKAKPEPVMQEPIPDEFGENDWPYNEEDAEYMGSYTQCVIGYSDEDGIFIPYDYYEEDADLLYH